MKKSVSALLLLATATSGVPTVAADDDSDQTAVRENGYRKIVKMARAMGGFQAILSLRGMQVTVEGSRVEPEQTLEPDDDPIPIVDYQFVHSQVFGSRKMHTQWAANVFYPRVTNLQFTEIVNGEHGAVIGVDSLLNQPEAPMLSARLASRTKQRLLESPLALIHEAARHPTEVKFKGVKKLAGKRAQVVSLLNEGQEIRVFIDTRTRLPIKVDTWEDDPVGGDTLWEVFYHDWLNVGGIRVPAKLIHRNNKRIIHTQLRTSVNLDLPTHSGLFDIPEELVAELDSDDFAFGLRLSQWLNRLLSAGVPFDINQHRPEAVNIQEIARGVYHVLAPLHNSLVVEMHDHLVMLEPPLHDERTQAVLAKVRVKWPSKPIRFMIASHFHNDHIGGIRGYGDIGATLVVAEEIEEFVEDIFAAPHTLYPDAFAKSPNKVTIKSVEDDEPLLLSDGTRNVRVFEIANSHAAGMLVTYIEDIKTVFVSDLYNPELFSGRIPPLFDQWGVDLLIALRQSGLDIEQVTGAHGGSVSYETFVNHIEASR